MEQGVSATFKNVYGFHFPVIYACLSGLLAYVLRVFALFFCFLVDLLENVKQFSSNELRSATEGFHSNNKIGRGGFGTVYKVNRTLLMMSSECSIVW